jgi:CheY-like chemotaxis protein
MTDVEMRKVLIVDDEPSVRFVLARTCEQAGAPHIEAAPVATAESGSCCSTCAFPATTASRC